MQPAKLMTNILPQYYAFIENEAQESNRSKREIIEEAIQLYMRESKKRKIMAQYAGMAQDEEYKNELLEGANLGMEYFLSDLEHADKQI